MTRAVLAEMDQETVCWNDLIELATKTKYGSNAKIAINRSSEREKEIMVKTLLSNSRIVAVQEPQVVSKTVLDVNEKEYENEATGTTIKIVNNCIESSRGQNYVQTTTRGITFGANVNDELQLVLPHFEAKNGIGGHISRTMPETVSKNSMVVTEDEVEVHPGEKIRVKMTSYKVCYSMQYTIEYGIDKNLELSVAYNGSFLSMILLLFVIIFSCLIPILIFLPCFCIFAFLLCKSKQMAPICGSRHGRLSAKELLQSLPTFREDEKKAYFRQEGVLTWTAERMVITKCFASQ